MKKILIVLLVSATLLARAQKAEDLFYTNDVRVSWLGVDFSNVKLIGDFSQFSGAGDKSPSQIKSIYFPAWNRVIINEREKYDVKGMLRKDEIFYDIDMIMAKNDAANVEEMESYNSPKYSEEDIAAFVKTYDTGGKSGIGIVLIAESLNKAATEASFHFVALNMATKEILIHERLSGEPKGFGLRNYWVGAVYDVMKQIEKNRYKNWRSEYAKR
jgi:hypothetical protein